MLETQVEAGHPEAFLSYPVAGGENVEWPLGFADCRYNPIGNDSQLETTKAERKVG